MEVDEIKSVRIEKRDHLRSFGVIPYGGRFEPTTTVNAALENFEEGREVKIAGRFVANRSHGKVIFADLQDQTGKIQLFIKVDVADSKTAQICRNLDVETRYRQRYVDLIANPEVKEVFLKRSKIISHIRSFLDQREFLEVETPMLQPMAGGARGRPFKSVHNAYDMEVFLRIAPELYLKRLLVGGLERVYEINRNFRNEGISTRHNPEFTMLEVYQSYGDFTDMMKLCEDLISGLAKEISGSYKITYQGKEIDFTPPWPRRSFAKIVKEKFDINPDDDAKAMLNKVKTQHGAKVKIDKLTRSAVMKIVEDLLEEDTVNQPLFVTEYFAFLSPLAKTVPGNPLIAQRFELFIAGMEVGNAYSELNDPEEQKKRLLDDLEDDVETGNRAIDEDFIHALEYGMPPAGGLGIGVDRLVMLLTDAPSIRDVILFPLLKPAQK